MTLWECGKSDERLSASNKSLVSDSGNLLFWTDLNRADPILFYFNLSFLKNSKVSKSDLMHAILLDFVGTDMNRDDPTVFSMNLFHGSKYESSESDSVLPWREFLSLTDSISER